MPETWDIAVVGAGAAGLMAAIHAGRAGGARAIVLDGARHLGAKILVSGGGRCNVTHETVSPEDFSGSSRNAVAKILRRFTVDDTRAFFSEQGVQLKLEPTGKYFPADDRARTVLDALLSAAREAGAVLRHPWRVSSLRRDDGGFRLGSAAGDDILARRVVLATGGRSLPKSGSDGGGYELARSLGHSLTPDIFPALVPLCLPAGHPFLTRAGISFDAGLEVRTGGKRRATAAGSVLCAHFGVSGPAVLDVSRHLLAARRRDPEAKLVLDALPGTSPEALDAGLRSLGSRTAARHLGGVLPDRLARAFLELAEVPPGRTGAALTRPERRRLVDALKRLELPVTGDRGFRRAEVTAGGVPLAELRLETLESRLCAGLFLCGEICDVDGRIGGFNFQWAWASGSVAGTGCATAPGGEADGPEPV